jgi:drug/metabolite transporter (DMT)-like permease
VTAIRTDATSRSTDPLRRGMAFGLLAALVWGGFLVVSRYGIASGLRATDLAFLRYLTSGVILLPWLLRHDPRRLSGIGWLRGLCLAALAGPLFILVGASGYRFAPLAHAAVIQLGMLTLMSILFAALILRERPSAVRLTGLAVVVCGLAVTAGPGILHGNSTAWVGDMLFALAGSMWALFSVLQRCRGIAPLTATAVVSVLSGAIYVPVYPVHAGLHALGSVSRS